MTRISEVASDCLQAFAGPLARERADWIAGYESDPAVGACPAGRDEFSWRLGRAAAWRLRGGRP